METREEILQEENRHRLEMCARMAKSLKQGDVVLDATGHRMYWRIDRKGKPSLRFDSIKEMESFLEHILENRGSGSTNGLGNMDNCVKRRFYVIRQRELSRTNGMPMMLSSRLNRQ